MTFRHSDTVDHLILLEDRVDLNRFLKQTVAELYFVGDTATIDLDFHEMSLLLFERGLSNLSVGEDANDGAIFLDALEFAGETGAFGFGCSLGVLGEGLLLRSVPVLVEAALEFI